MRVRFTDVAVRNLKEPGYHWDLSLPGFGIAVGAKARTFVTVNQGKRTKLGRYPSLTLADARKRAAAVLNNADTNSTALVSDAAEHYLDAIKIRPRTLYEYKRILRRHLIPTIGSRTLASLTAHDILAITDSLLDTPAECRHAHVAMQTFFNWCVPRHLPHSPMAGLRCPITPNKRDRVLTYPELAAIWAEAPSMDDFGHMAQLCILTGQRRGEIAQIQRAWLKPGLLTIPKEIAKNRREHAIPLTPTAQAIAERAPFKIGNWGRRKNELDSLSGIQGWVLHDLRRTFSTNLAELQVAPHIIERILNHVTGTISPLAATYNRATYQAEMRAAMERYEQELARLGVI